MVILVTMSLELLSDIEENHKIRSVATICMDRLYSEVHPVVPEVEDTSAPHGSVKLEHGQRLCGMPNSLFH